MKYEILTYGHPILREKARRVAALTEEIRQLAADMLETMYAGGGLGLAAQQIGKTQAICVIDLRPNRGARSEAEPAPLPIAVPMPLILINPEIVEEAKEKESVPEGCLSFPEINVPVRRALEVTVQFLDPENALKSLKARGLLARAVQHELDHLNGVLLVDRMSPVKKISLSGQLKKLKKESQAKLEQRE